VKKYEKALKRLRGTKIVLARAVWRRRTSGISWSAPHSCFAHRSALFRNTVDGSST